MKFIGIDLGWVSGASGLCCLAWQEKQLTILEITTKSDLSSILDWIDLGIAPYESGIIAVDAPTIIPNQTGMRIADKLTHQYFGRYHAGCYPANLNRPFAARTVGFGKSLITRGYQHAPRLKPQTSGRYQIEVFPHPAIVNLFGLTKILKYKKGKIADRKQELSKLKHYIMTVLPQLNPPLNIASPEHDTTLPPINEHLSGKELKNVEDQLDSLICAYVAAHWWYWGLERNLVLGDLNSGYIVVPLTSNEANQAR